MTGRLTGLAVILLCVGVANADEKLKGIACRSVHLGYDAPAGTAFYNEVTVDQSADGTYFCVCGFNKGYFGIQQLGNGKKLAIFSVWDPTSGDNPRSVPEEKRVKNLFKGEGVRIGRFGGEGTGGQSFYDFDWKPGATYRFLVTATPDGDRTAYAGYIHLPDAKTWKHLVTFSTLSNNKHLGGYYSFIEDFKRDKVSATIARKALYGNGWVKTKDGTWVELSTARFTGDSNPVLNIDAGLSGKSFFLCTGGKTENTTTTLKSKITREKSNQPPQDLPDLSK